MYSHTACCILSEYYLLPGTGLQKIPKNFQLKNLKMKSDFNNNDMTKKKHDTLLHKW